MAKGKEKWQFWNKKNALSFNSFELFWCTSIWKKTRLIGKELMNEKIIFSTFYCLTKRFCHYAFSYQSFYSNFCLKCIDKIWILIFSWSSEIFHSNFNFKKNLCIRHILITTFIVRFWLLTMPISQAN